MKKRKFAFLLALLLIFVSLPAGSVSAQEPITLFTPDYEDNSGPKYDVLNTYVEDMPALRAYLLGEFKKFNTLIDLSAFHIPAREEVRQAIHGYIWKDIPEAFNVYGLMAYSRYSDTDYDALVVSYVLEPQEYSEKMQACEDAAAQLLQGIVGNAALTQAEKALLLHDRLALLCEYDLSMKRTHCHDLYGALVEGVAVCEGYAKAYSYLLDQVGIKNYYCSSDLLNHGWNIVYIDGEAYHVDVTWDDPVNDMSGRVNHDNFLRSTVGFVETEHVVNNRIDYTVEPDDTRYDNAYWQNSETAFQLIGDTLYYVDHVNALLKQVKGGSHKTLLSVSDIWTYKNNSYWRGNYTRLATDGSVLFYSSSTAIHLFSPLTGKSTVLYEPELDLAEGFRIYGFVYEDGFLICDRNDSPNFDSTTKALYQIREKYHCVEKHSYDNILDLVCNVCGHERLPVARGDVDEDGGIDSDDAIYVLYHVLYPKDYPVAQACDYNDDKKVDSDDAIYLLYHSLYPGSYPL